MRSRFDRQLNKLNQELITMGSLCEETIRLVSDALQQGDGQLAKRAISVDHEIDQKEREIESYCLKLLLQQQPVARDLRQISAALKMITDMERIGDQTRDIAEITIFLQGRYDERHEMLEHMAVAAIHMVTKSIDAFVSQDIELAQEIIKYDDVVDNYFTAIKDKMIEKIEKKAVDGEYALDIMMIAKYLERIGDHATNIAEWVVFSVTGNHKNE